MSEPTYTITLTESERTLLAKAFGGLVTKLINAPIFVESPTGGTQAARAVLSPPSTTPPAAVPQPAPIAAHDRWATDRKGNPIPNPEGCEALDVHLWKIEQKPPTPTCKNGFAKVTWQIPNGRGYADAKCFDKELFPWLINQQGKQTRIYVVKSGQYTNIVGVRA